MPTASPRHILPHHAALESEQLWPWAMPYLGVTSVLLCLLHSGHPGTAAWRLPVGFSVPLWRAARARPQGLRVAFLDQVLELHSHRVSFLELQHTTSWGTKVLFSHGARAGSLVSGIGSCVPSRGSERQAFLSSYSFGSRWHPWLCPRHWAGPPCSLRSLSSLSVSPSPSPSCLGGCLRWNSGPAR